MKTQMQVDRYSQPTCAGAAVILTPSVDTIRAVHIELFVQRPLVETFEWGFLDSQRMPICNRAGQPLPTLVAELQFTPFCATPNCWEQQRVIDGLGGLPLWYGTTTFEIPKFPQSQPHYCSLELVLGDSDVTTNSCENRLYIERRKADLAIGIKPVKSYAFCLTHKTLAQRINQIDSHYQISARDSTHAWEALTNIFFNLLGGYDTALLDLDLE